MIDYEVAHAQLQQLALTQPFAQVDAAYDALAEQLQAHEQYTELCNLYYHQLSLQYLHGFTLQAIHTLSNKRTLFEQYASKQDILRIRKETIFILETLGYRENYDELLMTLYEEAKRLQMPILICDITNALGYYFYTLLDYALAEQYFLKCIAYSEAHTNVAHNYGYIRALINVANLYEENNKLPLAEQYLAKFEQAPVVKVPAILSAYYFVQMNVARKQQKLSHALHNANKLLALDIEHIYWLTIPFILKKTATFFEEIGDTERAIAIFERFNTFLDNYNSYEVTQLSIACKYDLAQTLLVENLQEDSLTGVLNRFGFEQAVLPLLEQKKQQWIACAILDVDYFKNINDTYGHLVGDEVLKEIARRALLYDTNKRHYFGRYGGDEFYAVHEAETKAELLRQLNRFYNQLIAEPFTYQDISLSLSISCGAVYAQNTSHPLQYWINKADQQLYAVKKQGRGHLQTEHLYI